MRSPLRQPATPTSPTIPSASPATGLLTESPRRWAKNWKAARSSPFLASEVASMERDEKEADESPEERQARIDRIIENSAGRKLALRAMEAELARSDEVPDQVPVETPRTRGRPRVLGDDGEKFLASAFYAGRMNWAHSIRDQRQAMVHAELKKVKSRLDRLGRDPLKEEDRAEIDDSVDKIIAKAQGLELERQRDGR